VDVPTLLRSVRQSAGLTQRQLAERAGTSAAAVCLYEQGARVPRTDTLARLLAAAGTTLVLGTTGATTIDLEANGRALVDVLELADALPQRPAGPLDQPVFAELAT
jgi:transcriptional regulator with XRE-family HTH domain